MKFNNAQNNFTAGEWSKKAASRAESQQYFNACEELTNFIPQISGGAFRRAGTTNISGSDPTLTAKLSAGFLGANPYAVKSKMIPRAVYDGIDTFLVAFDGQPSTTWAVMNEGNTEIGFGSVGAGADYVSNAKDLKYAQTGNLVFIVTPNGQPRVWSPDTLTGGILDTLAGHNTPSSGIGDWETFPYLKINALGSSVNITTSAATGSITLTASAAFFDTGHVGAYFKFTSAGSTGAVVVTGYTSSTVVTASVLATVPVATMGTAAGTGWEESAWSIYRGWPRNVVAHQGRLYYLGSTSYPDTIWASRIGNVLAMMEVPFVQDATYSTYTTNNARPFTLTPNSAEASNIATAIAGKNLFVMTDKSEIVASGGSSALGPLTANYESGSSFGADTAQAVRSNNFVTFVQKGGRKLRELVFNYDEDQYTSNDLSFLADHLTLDPNSTPEEIIYSTPGRFQDPIVEIISSRSETGNIFAKTNNGRLLCLTLDRTYNVNAWSRIVFGGTSGVRDYPLVKSMCSIGGELPGYDRVFFLVVRHINGSDVVTIERLDFINEAITGSYEYLDSKVNGYIADSTRKVWNGFDNYKGETLQVISDGNYLGEYTVSSSGQITFPDAVAGNVIAGFKYTSTLKTLPIELGQQVPNSPLGFIKRVDESHIKFFLSRGAKYGYKESDMIDIDFKSPTEIMGDPPKMFTGLKTVKMPTDYGRECQIIIKQDKPFPCNVLAIISKGVLYD